MSQTVLNRTFNKLSRYVSTAAKVGIAHNFELNRSMTFARNCFRRVRFKPICIISSTCRSLSTEAVSPSDNSGSYIAASDPETLSIIKRDMLVQPDFVSEEEEKSLLNEVEPYLKRLRYESSHWDDAIHSYRETERSKWTQKNNVIIQRIRDTAFPPEVSQLAYVHVLDIKKEGYIKPHVDAVKFCGDTIAGICLLSSAIMRLVNCDDKEKYADILLKQRSLYIMKNDARYKYTHEVLPQEKAVFRGTTIPRDRRISIICRNNP